MKRTACRDCTILVVDDDASLAATLQELLQDEGYTAEVALSGAEALTVVDTNPNICVAMVDLMMPVIGGLELLDRLRLRNPDLAVIIMTGFGTIETAVEAIKRGAEDYLTKPFHREAIQKKVARLTEVFRLRHRVEELESSLERCPSFENFIHVSPQMRRVVERAQAAAASQAPVLLVGETGTGKEMLAHAIHLAGGRSRHPFLPLNCGALPRELVESELFGYRRGAFTGAYTASPGVFVSANHGTVFLDEIGEMPKDVQVKLLRVLQENEVRAVGNAQAVHVDVRVISAANRPLAEMRSQYLREDFYFRISTVLIEIPPLRVRPDDIVVLAQHFASRLGRRYGRQITITRPALDLLLAYPFPGNVRELENILESVTALSTADPQTITDRDLRPLLDPKQMPVPETLGEQPLSMERLEQFAIQQVLRVCQGNRTRAAAMLGISRDTLYRKMKQSAAN